MLKVMFVTVRPLLTLEYPHPAPPLPDVGDEVWLNNVRHKVMSRVWTIVPSHTVAIHLSEQ